jgi:nucleotide-binding universal stress UspA family protein
VTLRAGARGGIVRAVQDDVPAPLPAREVPMAPYTRILVPLEHSPYDAAILAHVRPLARLCGASLVCMHVADGWAARNLRQLSLQESEEMRRDRAYLEQVCAELTADGLDAEPLLGCGDPADEILAAAERERCDLIAMATHGHRFLADVVYGSVAEAVRHRSLVPVLLVRGERRAKPRDETPVDPVDAVVAVPPPA